MLLLFCWECFIFGREISSAGPQRQLKLKVEASWAQFQVTSKGDQANTPSRKVYPEKLNTPKAPGREDDLALVLPRDLTKPRALLTVRRAPTLQITGARVTPRGARWNRRRDKGGARRSGRGRAGGRRCRWRRRPSTSSTSAGTSSSTASTATMSGMLCPRGLGAVDLVAPGGID